MSLKPDPRQYVQFDNPKSGCGLGCWAIGCTGVIAVVLMLCGGGFYGLIYTSLPLKWIEAAIEQDGEVEIEGLEGNLATGFSADELRFKTVDDKWSNLTDIKFKYAGKNSFFGSDSLIIEELSINGGTIYADWDPEENEFDFDSQFGDELDEINNEFEDMGDEFGHFRGIRELRIDLVRIANLKIVNPTTQLAITLDEVKFEGFQIYKDELKSMGELLVRSSQLDLVTVPSTEYAEMKNAKRFEGILRAQADHRLKTDVPFVVDFAIGDDFELFLNTQAFGDEIHFVQTPEASSLTYDDFTPSEFIELKNGQILQSQVDLQLEYGKKFDKGPTKVNQDGSFTLGKIRFSDMRIEQPEGKSAYLVGEGQINGETVTAHVRIESPYSPLWKVKLLSEAFETPEETWSQTLFGETHSNLSEENQAAVVATMPPVEPAPAEPVDPDVSSAEDSESADAAADVAPSDDDLNLPLNEDDAKAKDPESENDGD